MLFAAKIGGLSIKTNFSEMLGASYHGDEQTTYQYLAPREHPADVYVFAVDGNRRSGNTTVDVEIPPAGNATIVLVNNYRVTWYLKVTINVSRIVLVRNVVG